uniref:Reverse transcriptase zinc-binding domain-containing protein n=1 Tax=Cannabis sativa TaxID=3483 RepID=A0A803Q469_CANSA
MSWKRLSRHKNDVGMGFLDLRDYNLAFLGKQGWRLLTNEDSLVSKIYKARYYPSGSFLTATLGQNSSFIWKSILEAQGLVQAGVRKSIGNGTNVSILLDPWLPDPSNPYVLSDHPRLMNQNVSSLFSVQSKSWDLDIVNDLFEERDKNLVLSIQLSENATADEWYWSKEANGFYTVKSTYRLLQQASGVDIAVNDQTLFKFLWQLDIPPKVHHFLWRVLVGCLPTKVQFSTKNVNVDLYCPFCNSALETISHILIKCRFARSCWCVSIV